MRIYSYWDIYTPEKLQAAKGLWLGLLCCAALIAVVSIAIGVIFYARKRVRAICLISVILCGISAVFFQAEAGDSFRFQPASELEYETYEQGIYSEYTGILHLQDVTEKGREKNKKYRVSFRVDEICFRYGIMLNAEQLEMLRSYGEKPVKIQYSVWPAKHIVYSLESCSQEQLPDVSASERTEEAGEHLYNYFAECPPEKFTGGMIAECLFGCIPLVILVGGLIIFSGSENPETWREKIFPFIFLIIVSYEIVNMYRGLAPGSSIMDKKNWELYQDGVYSECCGTLQVVEIDGKKPEDIYFIGEEDYYTVRFKIDDVYFYTGLDANGKDLKKMQAQEGKEVRARYSVKAGQESIYTLEALSGAEEQQDDAL